MLRAGFPCPRCTVCARGVGLFPRSAFGLAAAATYCLGVRSCPVPCCPVCSKFQTPNNEKTCANTKKRHIVTCEKLVVHGISRHFEHTVATQATVENGPAPSSAQCPVAPSIQHLPKQSKSKQKGDRSRTGSAAFYCDSAAFLQRVASKEARRPRFDFLD